MADFTIGQLPAASALTGTELVEYQQGGESRQGAISVLRDWVLSGGGRFLTGITAPGGGDGSNGDVWLDTAANTIYGPKAEGAWPAGVSLVGPAGPAGSGGLAEGEITLSRVPSGVSEGRVIVAPGTGADWDVLIREIGNVIHVPGDATHPYRMFYSGSPDPYTGTNVGIGWASSTDGITWTKQGQLTLGRAAEDPYAVLVGGTVYLYVEDKADVPFRNIRLYTSTDMATWTDEGDVLDIGTGWEAQDVSSPVVWVEDGTWHMLYEGRSADNWGAVGHATSADGIAWVKDASNPVLTGDNPAAGFTDPELRWARAVVPDDICKVDGVYILTGHALVARGGALQAVQNGWFACVATSRDLLVWEDAVQHPISVPGNEGIMLLPGRDRAAYVPVSGGIAEGNTAGAPLVSVILREGTTQTGFTSGSYQKKVFERPLTSVGSAWDEATHTFTAPRSGLYQFIYTQSFSPSSTGRLSVRFSFPSLGIFGSGFSGDFGFGTAAVLATANTAIWLAAGETACFEAYAQNGVVSNGLGPADASIIQLM
jgi:hypothetical protein